LEIWKSLAGKGYKLEMLGKTWNFPGKLGNACCVRVSKRVYVCTKNKSNLSFMTTPTPPASTIDKPLLLSDRNH